MYLTIRVWGFEVSGFGFRVSGLFGFFGTVLELFWNYPETLKHLSPSKFHAPFYPF